MQKLLRSLIRSTLAGICLLLAISSWNFMGVGVSLAQAQSAPAAHGKATGIPEKRSDGTWEGLSPAQQKILAPLEEDWNYLIPESRKRWTQVATLYPKLSQAEQQRLQSRMAIWSKLPQKDRRIARENYLSSLKFPAEKKAEAWSAYQKLSEDEKKKLAQAEINKKKPTVVSAPTMQQHPINPTMTSQLPPRTPKGGIPPETSQSSPSTSSTSSDVDSTPASN